MKQVCALYLAINMTSLLGYVIICTCNGDVNISCTDICIAVTKVPTSNPN